MPRIESRSLVWAFAAFVGVWAFLGQRHNAEAYSSYRGLWEARENGEGRFLQRYDHQFSVNLDQDLSDRLNARENVNYGYRSEDELGSQESVSPGASLDVKGEYFLANLAVNSVRGLSSQSLQPDSDTVALSWSSSWKKSLVPQLRLNYDYGRYKVDSAERKLDEKQKNFAGDVKWDLRLVQVNYSYRKDESKYTNYKTIQDSQMARINASRVWLDNRLRVTMGYEYNESRNENLVSFDSTSTANIFVSLTSAYTGLEAFPENPTTIPPDTSDVASYLLSDPNLPLDPPAYSVPVHGTTGNYYIRLENNTGKPVDRIYLYTQDNLGVDPGNALSMRLYYNNGDYTMNPWTPELGISRVYDAINQRFVISVPSINARYLKVVIDRNLTIPNINLTEVKVEQILHGIVGTTESIVTKFNSNKSNFSLDFRLNHAVAFYYNFLVASDKANAITTNENESHNAGTRLQNVAGDLRANFSYSLSKRRYLGSPDGQTQTYLVDLNKVLLPTLTVSLGGSHEASSQGGLIISDRNRYTLYTDAKLYPDLTSRLEVIYWEQKSYHPGLENTLSDDLRTQFTLTSRFRPSLVVSFVGIYEVQNQDKKIFDKKNSSSLVGSWQLSEWCSLNGSVQRDSSQRTKNSYLYALGMVVGLGAGLEWRANYSLQDFGGVSQTGMTSLRWSSHQNVSWEVGCDYAESNAETLQNVYKVYSKLLVSFATQ